MEEKVMVNDTLEAINSNLTRFGEMIPQTDNAQLKSTLKQIRNQCEVSQEELYQIAREKQYYQPAHKATEDEVNRVKMIFEGNKTM